MKRSWKFLIVFLIGIGITIPIGIIVLNKNNQSNDLLLISLVLKNNNISQNTVDWPILINGSAVSVPINMSYSNFTTESDFDGYILIKAKIGGSTVEWNSSYMGISFIKIIHDIMGISSYSSVKILASDGYYKSFQQADIENPSYADDFYLMYKMDGQNLTDYYHPVYCVITQHYTVDKYLDSWNGQWCVRHVIAFEINT